MFRLRKFEISSCSVCNYFLLNLDLLLIIFVVQNTKIIDFKYFGKIIQSAGAPILHLFYNFLNM